MSFVADLGEQVFDVLAKPETFQKVTGTVANALNIRPGGVPSTREGIRTAPAVYPPVEAATASGGATTLKWGAGPTPVGTSTPIGAGGAQLRSQLDQQGGGVIEIIDGILGGATKSSREFTTSVDNNTILNMALALGGVVLLWKLVK